MAEDQPSAQDEAREICARVLGGMSTLRDFEPPGPEAEPPEVNDALHEIRARLDQAEVLMKEILRLKGRSWARSDNLAALADDAFDAAWDRAVQSGRGRDFEGVKDREVAARMASLNERRKARTAKSVARLADNAHQRAQVDYYGLLNVREELLTRLSRYLPWLASMET